MATYVGAIFALILFLAHLSGADIVKVTDSFSSMDAISTSCFLTFVAFVHVGLPTERRE